jgi:hypothetical protein
MFILSLFITYILQYTILYINIITFGFNEKYYKIRKIVWYMPRISDEKIERISEQIVFYLYGVFPKLVFTSDIARELARDEEFVKRLLLGLEEKGLVLRVGKNSKGVDYLKRMRWRISNRAHEIYSAA